MNCNFSIGHYEECIKKISESKYENTMLHDVDFWTDNMNHILKIEIDYNINSIWFFRFHAKNYNLLSYDNINFLKNFKSLHNIECGIHIEPFYLNEFNLVDEQITIVEKIIEKPIKYGSIHEPTRFPFENINFKNKLKIISYKSDFMNNKKYISDSSSNWREGCMCKHIDNKNLVILTHPNWWYKKYSGEIY
jgi:hypothetical protein